MGSRYGGLKQMDPMGPNGETVLDYSVFDALRAGFGKVVFVIREDFADAFRESVGARFAGHLEVAYAFQKLDDLPEGFEVPEGREKPWGTAHAVRAARHELDRPFAVINADDFYGQDAYQVAFDFLTADRAASEKAAYALVGYHMANTLSEHGSVNRGVCTSHGGLLTGVEEIVEIARKENGTPEGRTVNGEAIEVAEDAIASMNFWCFPQSFLDTTEAHFVDFLKKHGTEPKSECYIPTIVDEAVASGKAECFVLETSANWFGVTYPADKPHVVASIQGLVDEDVYPSPLLG